MNKIPRFVLVVSGIKVKLSKRNADIVFSERERERGRRREGERMREEEEEKDTVFGRFCSGKIHFHEGITPEYPICYYFSPPFQLQGMLRERRFCSLPLVSCKCVWCCINIIKYFPSPSFCLFSPFIHPSIQSLMFSPSSHSSSLSNPTMKPNNETSSR